MTTYNQVKALLWKNSIVYARSYGEWLKDIIYTMVTSFLLYKYSKDLIFRILVFPLMIPIGIIGFHRKLVINVVHDRVE